MAVDFEKMLTEPLALSEPQVKPPGVPTRESLRGLAFALRHPETWPKGFVWDYSECDQCAMGLAYSLWLKADEDPPDGQDSDKYARQWVSLISRRFSVPYRTAERIFFGIRVDVEEQRLWGLLSPRVTRKWRPKDVTPEMVADAIDHYLASRVD